MSGTYMICDLCGNAGPPAAFLIDHGTRVCYVCADAQQHEQGQEEKPMRDTRIDQQQTDDNADPVAKS